MSADNREALARMPLDAYRALEMDRSPMSSSSSPLDSDKTWLVGRDWNEEDWEKDRALDEVPHRLI